MTDPQRLSRNPSNPLAALLLRSGAEEKPSAAVLSRTTEAVAAAAAAATASAAAASAASTALSAARATGGNAVFKGATLGVGAVAKWVAIGALGGAVALSSVQALIAGQGTKHTQVVPAPAANALTEKPSQRSTATTRTIPELVASAEPRETVPPNAGEAQRAHSTEPALADLAKPEAPGHTDGAFLAAEVRFVEQGRSLLQRAAFAEALDQLAPYEDRFPHQQLLTEVLFLRMEASSRLGNVERARALAARVLTLGVVGRQAAQAREVLAP